MNARTERLRALMAQYNLTSRQVGEILKRSTQTVRVWRSRWDGRAIPAHSLELLEIRLAERNA